MGFTVNPYKLAQCSVRSFNNLRKLYCAFSSLRTQVANTHVHVRVVWPDISLACPSALHPFFLPPPFLFGNMKVMQTATHI